MNIELFNGKLSGMNGITETILQAVINDSRWLVRWVGWNDNVTERVVNLAFHHNGKLTGTIDIRITENHEAE